MFVRVDFNKILHEDIINSIALDFLAFGEKNQIFVKNLEILDHWLEEEIFQYEKFTAEMLKINYNITFTILIKERRHI